MNLPNKLTCFRMLISPIIVIFAYLPIEALEIQCGFVSVRFLVILALFCIGSITDYFDGEIARKKNLITTFGKFLDPIADKLLVVASLLVLAEFDMIPVWIIFVTEARELLVAASRMLQAKNGKVVAASWYGKVKTVSQMIAIILAFICSSSFFAFIGGPEADAFKAGGMPQFVLNILMSIAMCVSLIAAVFSGWDYIKASKNEILESK